MLRKKLLARLGLLVIGFVTGAVVSITLLQNVLHDLDAMKADAEALIDGVQHLGSAFSALETQADAVRQSQPDDSNTLALRAAQLMGVMDRLGGHEVMRAPGGPGAPAIARLGERLPGFFVDAARPTASGAAGPEVHVQADAIRGDIAELGRIARAHVSAEQASLSRNLRTLIVMLTIAALIITNIAIYVLVRTANMVLRPVGDLITGSRELAREHFDYRIRITQQDEFQELAKAYNALADQLAANEQRKITALQQLAVTLNHELNNVINIIDLQLSLLNRRSGGDPILASHLGDIHANLERIARTIASLRSVRRVVLTDYLPGETMLDLPRCIAPDDAAHAPHPEPAASHHS